MAPVAVTRPRVFVSSTIRDLRDVRSALRYWLESAGYDVQLSEYNDFDRRPEHDTFEACFGNIRTSDYYILLIGRSHGSWYKGQHRLTVTRQEFRVALNAAKEGSLRIIPFVRAEVKGALRQWKADGRPKGKPLFVDDPSFTHAFLGEVERSSKSAGRLGSQWIYEFTDFKDIVDALRSTLRLETDLAGRLVQENLLNELLYNLTLLVTKTTTHGTVFPKHWWLGARKDIVISPDQLTGRIWLTAEQLGKSIGMIGFVSGSGTLLRRSALREAIRSGLFLEIEPISGALKQTETHKALLQLDDDIDYLIRNAGSEVQGQINQKFMMLAYQANKLGQGAYVEVADLVLVLRLHDVFDDGFKATSRIAQWLLGVVASPSIERNPISPIQGESEAVRAESLNSDEIKELLRAQVYPFGPRLTPGLIDLIKEKLPADKSLVPRLRSMLPAEVSAVLSDAQVRNIAEEALTHFTASALETDNDTPTVSG